MTTRCRHECACGAVLICGDPERCAVGPRWQCQACELDHVDRYFSLLEETESHEPQQSDREPAEPRHTLV